MIWRGKEISANKNKTSFALLGIPTIEDNHKISKKNCASNACQEQITNSKQDNAERVIYSSTSQMPLVQTIHQPKLPSIQP